jgi:hypothetical protein
MRAPLPFRKTTPTTNNVKKRKVHTQRHRTAWRGLGRFGVLFPGSFLAVFGLHLCAAWHLIAGSDHQGRLYH